MSEIEVTIALIGQPKTTKGFLNNDAMIDLVEEFDYVRCGKVTAGRFMQAHIPAEKFEELSKALGKSCNIARKL